ncbi:AcuC Deacetylases, including yeast histone deacetylase and acetoin utilization protein [Oxalobacteraceae bacterium]
MSTVYFSHPDCLLHEMGEWHPESPARLQVIEDQLIASGLSGLIERRDAPLAAIEDVRRVHSETVVERIRSHLPAPGDTGYFALDADTLINSHSWRAALRAAGGAVAATDAVVAGEFSTAFCAVRPPGHHATPDASMGFCLFNNIAIAVRHALAVHGFKRVAVVDFDVHHGNGTEAAFLNDPRVLMVSFFQSPLYPYSGEYPDGERPVHLVNIPVPAYTRGDRVRELVQRDWLPALHAHRPEMIFISAGFDAHREDELASMGLIESDYAWITRQLRAVADQYAQGRIVSCLEGGYHLSALGRSVIAHLKALAGLA